MTIHRRNGAPVRKQYNGKTPMMRAENAYSDSNIDQPVIPDVLKEGDEENLVVLLEADQSDDEINFAGVYHETTEGGIIRDPTEQEAEVYNNIKKGTI